MAAVNGTISAAATASPTSSSAAGATAFSYAQAAKGKSAAPQSPRDSKAPAKDTEPALHPAEHNMNWAEDSQTMVDSQEVRPNGDARKGSRSSTGDAKSADASNGGSTLAASRSSSMPKDDDQSPHTAAPSELPWRRRPHENESLNDSNSDVASQKEDRKDKVKDKTQFVDAPAPMVNFWAQRAHDAKSKGPQLAATAGAPAPAPPAPSAPVTNGPQTSSKVPDAAPGEVARRAANSRSRSVGASARERKAGGSDERSGRPSRAEPSAGRGRVPSMEDSRSWPTPEIAKDDEKKKPQGKMEPPQSVPTVQAKPHGKNEKWVQMEFTPSVKFETPLPLGGRRGGRPSPRGGREAGGRGAFSGTNGRPVNGAMSAQTPEDANGPADARLEPTTGKIPGQGTKPKKTLDDSNKSVAHGSKLSKDDISTGPSQHHSHATSDAPIPAESDRVSPRSNLTTAEAGSNAQADGGARRKASRTNDGDMSASKFSDVPPGERKRGNSIISSAAKPGWNERRVDSGRSNDKLDLANGFGRGEGRFERGRGGKRGGFSGGHNPGSYPMTPNGTNAPPFYSPKSAPFQSGGSFPGMFTPRGNMRANGSRASSLPTDVALGPNMPAGYPTSPPGYYGFPNMPAMNFPQFDPYTQQMALMNGIAHQLNYYFSFNNLIKDMFLRQHMSSSGYVPLTFIASFSRMKQLTTDINLVRVVAEQSPEYVVRTDTEGQMHMRKRDDWEQFVLPMEDRKPMAQNDGPAFVEEHSQQPFYEAAGQRHAAEAMFQPVQPPMYPHFSPVPTGSPVNGFAQSPPNRYSMSTIESPFGYHQPPPTPFLSAQARSVEAPQDEPDAFPDDKIEQLTVVVRPKTKDSQQPEMARSTSHGSLDGDMLMPKTETPDEGANGTHKREHSARLADIKKSLTSPPPSHKSQPSASSNVGLFWIKEQGEEPEQLPQNSTYEPYGQVCANALQQRQNAASGQCPYDMNLLYQFWSHFLLRNFNTRMYIDFRTMAHEDAKQSSNKVGLTNLMKYYKDSLLSQRMIRNQVAQDYVALVAEEDKGGERVAFKQLRSAWRNGALNLKNRKIVGELIEPELQAELDR